MLEDPLAVALGGEPVRVFGSTLGRVTSGGYAYTAGRSIAFAYLPREQAVPGAEAAVEVEGAWVAAEVAGEPLHEAAAAAAPA